MPEQASNFGRTRTDGSVTNVATSFDVIDGSVFPATGNFRLNCEDELMLCTARSSNTLTVTRGIEGTTAAAHGSGVYVTQVNTAGGFQQLLDEAVNTAHKLFMYNNFK